jgi:hypothetical protein
VRRILAGLEFKADAPQPPFMIGLQIHERGVCLYLCDKGARLVAPKPAQTLEGDRRGRLAAIAERLVDVAREASIGVTDEAQGNVIVVRLKPARADDPAAQMREPHGDGIR